MRFNIITVGKCRTDFIQRGIEFYLGRLKHYCKVQLSIVKEEPVRKKIPESEILKKEAERILAAIPAKSYVFALDRSGSMIDSLGLSGEVERLQIRYNAFTFIVGGVLGLDDMILKRADRILSFSRLTFTHEMSALMLTEQVYRIQTILRSEKYHK